MKKSVIVAIVVGLLLVVGVLYLISGVFTGNAVRIGNSITKYPSCIDSDGKNYNVRGSITYDSKTFSWTTLKYDWGKYQDYDYCGSSLQLVEFVCSGSYRSIVGVSCVKVNGAGSKCVNGACTVPGKPLPTPAPTPLQKNAGISILLVSSADFLTMKMATVVLESKNGNVYSSVLERGSSDSVVFYKFSGLADGTYILKMSAAGHTTRTDSVKVTSGNDGNVPGYPDMLRYTLFTSSGGESTGNPTVCVDSDVNATYPDGKNFMQKGNVAVGSVKIEDYCTGTDPESIFPHRLFEQICVGGKNATIVKPCSELRAGYVCSNGACR